MVLFHYHSRGADKQALRAIEDRIPFDFVVSGSTGRLVRVAIPVWNTVFTRDANFVRRLALGVRLCWYALRTPHFWPVYAQARLRRMEIIVDERGDDVVISFRW